MTNTDILSFLNTYGIIIIFIVVFLEYLNLPGFPAGVILPTAGAWASTNIPTFFLALTISVIAGLLGSIVLYLIGFWAGNTILEKLFHKLPKQRIIIDNYTKKLQAYQNKTLLISKLIPCIRTLIGIPAGILKINFSQYLIYSTIGIVIWNGVLMFSGFIVFKFM